jgi:isochorismate hydrolase
MKEVYFTGPILSCKAHEMLDNVSSLRARHQEIMFNPGASSLLVLDMQEYFLNPASHAFVPCGRVILPRLSDLVDAFSAARRPVIFTQHSNTAGEAGMMDSWWEELLLSGSPAWQIATDLDTSKGHILQKSQYDAFFNTSLEATLRKAGATQVVIGGVMTHLCCETTARSAFMRGFQVFFTIDGTASYNEAYHQASLLNLSHGFAIPVLVEEIEEAFDW